VVGGGNQASLTAAFFSKPLGAGIWNPDLDGTQTSLPQGIAALLNSNGNGSHGILLVCYM
jgi:hypothetical protein